MKKNILITGGAGFVGSNLALFLKSKLKDCNIICYDNLIRKGSSLNKDRLEDSSIEFIKGDVRDRQALLDLKDIDVIVECSAEPSVLAGHKDPSYTVDTNLIGALHCLELAKREKADFIFLSTSRVYPTDEINRIKLVESPTRIDFNKEAKGLGYSYQGITEEFPLNGSRSLYGATKLCVEVLAAEYFNMFSIKGVINRLGVIAGPWQMGKIDQGIVGYWLAQHKYNTDLSYIGYGGSGKQVRDVIHVDDVCDLLLYEINNIDKLSGKTFNVGGGRKNSFSLCELTEAIQNITKNKIAINSVLEERKDDIKVYITDHSRITQQIGWTPSRSLEDVISDTNKWIDTYKDKLKNILAK